MEACSALSPTARGRRPVVINTHAGRAPLPLELSSRNPTKLTICPQSLVSWLCREPKVGHLVTEVALGSSPSGWRSEIGCLTGQGATGIRTLLWVPWGEPPPHRDVPGTTRRKGMHTSASTRRLRSKEVMVIMRTILSLTASEAGSKNDSLGPAWNQLRAWCESQRLP